MAQSGSIGVLTFHRCINYGSYWQARCLVEGLQQRGVQAELLDHDSPEVNLAEWRCSLQPGLPERSSRPELKKYKRKARRFFDAWDHLPRSRAFPLESPEAAGSYDAVVVGSDEVWNFRHPWYRAKPIFFGSGLQTERLVSYAASFGNHDADDGVHPHWAERLRRFDAISVRDANSRSLVKGATGLDPAVVLDPCLQWPDFARAEPMPAEHPYAVVYGHGLPWWLVQQVRRWADETGTRLISLGYSNEWTHEQRIDEGPMEFARWMAGANAVVTNFFHGCVFALLNGKPFVASPSDYRFNKIRDLTAKLHATDRVVTDGTQSAEFDRLMAEPVSEAVEANIRSYRARSQDYLDAALS
ncbi:polysaccharide pyruvyl transferase family protein [Sphingomonas arenae]|uniref:polysaccharide pyruvyl transferase family protein n=1 Tax=Sphingomonas arenae TaxID=2812555 RepID=UPI0019684516|nr:polysaccharide pyruvyl transferase family protein [Sphingomonas arenae]